MLSNPYCSVFWAGLPSSHHVYGLIAGMQCWHCHPSVGEVVSTPHIGSCLQNTTVRHVNGDGATDGNENEAVTYCGSVVVFSNCRNRRPAHALVVEEESRHCCHVTSSFCLENKLRCRDCQHVVAYHQCLSCLFGSFKPPYVRLIWQYFVLIRCIVDEILTWVFFFFSCLSYQSPASYCACDWYRNIWFRKPSKCQAPSRTNQQEVRCRAADTCVCVWIFFSSRKEAACDLLMMIKEWCVYCTTLRLFW